MYQENGIQIDCKPQSQISENKDPKKAVELSIVILVDQDEKQQPCPPPCPPPCCTPCCLPPCCMPMPCCPCQARPCSGGGYPQSRPQTATGQDPCGNLPRVKSQTAACQTPTHGGCQTDPYQPQQGRGSAAGCQTQQGGTRVCCRKSKTAVCQTMDGPRRSDGSRQSGEAPDDICRAGVDAAKELAAGEEGGGAHRKHKHKRHRHKKDKEGKRRSSSVRRPSIPAEQLSFNQCPSTQMSFVQYFLKNEAGTPLVMDLAKAKLEFEKKCKAKLSKFPKHVRYQAQDYFMKVILIINTQVPDTQNTGIRHYHIMKYLHPVLSKFEIVTAATHDSHAVHRYHKYILSVVKKMDDLVKRKEVVNPTCIIELETQLMAGIVSRFFPIFIRIKDKLVSLIKEGTPNEQFTPDEFLKHIRKLLLCIYVEIVCIDHTFTNALTGMCYIDDVASQENFRRQFVMRRKHARHATKWAARCLATVLLYYYMIDM